MKKSKRREKREQEMVKERDIDKANRIMSLKDEYRDTTGDK